MCKLYRPLLSRVKNELTQQNVRYEVYVMRRHQKWNEEKFALKLGTESSMFAQFQTCFLDYFVGSS